MSIAPVGLDFILNSTTTGDQRDVQMTALDDGRMIAVWRSDDGADGAGTCIRARIFNSDGSASGVDFVVNFTGAGDQGTPAVTQLDDGRIMMCWTNSDGAMRARFFGANGVAQGNDFLVNTTANTGGAAISTITLTNGNVVVTWGSTDTGDGSQGCIRARMFDANGAPVGNDFIVNSTGTNWQANPEVTQLAGGRFAVVWQSDDTGDGSQGCIRARIFNASGTAVGADFIVNSASNDSQSRPWITTLADGRFIASWQSSDGGDGDGSCIRARIFNANGTSVGADFVVNSSAPDGQSHVAITGLADGRFVAVWADNDPAGDGSEACIRARLFNANGVPIGADFVANTTGAQDQLRPFVREFADGRIMIAWTHEIKPDPDQPVFYNDVRGRIFDPNLYNGTAGADVLTGTSANDKINGLAGNDRLSGAAGNDVLSGGDGNDTLNGGLGADRMTGGAGNDVYTVDNVGDRVIEAANGGTDSVNASITHTLAVNVERLTLTGTAAINGTGNVLANIITGNAAINKLSGMDGNDTLNGMGGNDQLLGGNGNDKLDGGLGVDRLTGGAGNDVFLFTTIGAGTTNRDTIVDFANAAGNNDIIHLDDAVFKSLAPGALAAANFRLGVRALDADDYVIYNQTTGILSYDADGNGAGAAVQIAVLSNKAALTLADFLVV